MSQKKIHIANAPCSWGVLEFEGLAENKIPYQTMLDELVETGYTGTDLGDWAYMPTDPTLLRSELEKRNLTMMGAFVDVALKNPAAHAAGKKQALKVARLLAAVANVGDPNTHPILVLADKNGTDPLRTQNAGRITPSMGLSDTEWDIFVKGAEDIAQAVKMETGLKTGFHHHCAGYIETPDEIYRFLSMTNPNLIGLVFDTGHYAYGAGNCNNILMALNKYVNRLLLIHFKDCHPTIMYQAKTKKWDYFQAIQHGIFSSLGQGCVPFLEIVYWLREQSKLNWILVEQDVLPGCGTPKENAQLNRNYLTKLGL